MRSRERSERRAEPELFPKPLCRKGVSDPTDRREGGGASDFGITSGIYEVLRRRSKIWVRGEPSPEPYIPCYTPRRPKGGERSGARLKGASSKNIFRSHSLDRLSLIIINLIFSVLKNERGFRGEFHFSKHIIINSLPKR